MEIFCSLYYIYGSHMWLLKCHLCDFLALIWASLIAQLVTNPSVMQETQVRLLGREDMLEQG